MFSIVRLYQWVWCPCLFFSIQLYQFHLYIPEKIQYCIIVLRWLLERLCLNRIKFWKVLSKMLNRKKNESLFVRLPIPVRWPAKQGDLADKANLQRWQWWGSRKRQDLTGQTRLTWANTTSRVMTANLSILKTCRLELYKTAPRWTKMWILYVYAEVSL